MDNNQLYFRVPQKPRVPITLAPYRWGPNGHVVVASTDHSVWFALSGNIAALVVQLRAATKRLEEMICTETERGIVRGETENQSEEFSFITANDLNGDPAHDWPLIAARFPWLRDAVPAQYLNGKARLPVTTTQYLRANGNGHLTVDQLSLDLEMVKAIAHDLIDNNGQPVWGAQSRIAEALGIANAGATNRKRIKAVLSELSTGGTPDG